MTEDQLRSEKLFPDCKNLLSTMDSDSSNTHSSIKQESTNADNSWFNRVCYKIVILNTEDIFHSD